MIVLLLIAGGLVLGSFVNAFVWRMHEQMRLSELKPSKKIAAEKRALSITRGRSMCSHCRHALSAADLVPVLSWLWLRGRCRYCGHRIEDTPLPELAVPLLFLASYLWWPESLHGAGAFAFGLWLVFVVAFVALAVHDFRWFLLPDKIVLPLIGLAAFQVLVLWLWFGQPWQAVMGAAAGALIIAGGFYVIFMISDGTWIGGGDVKLAVVLGLLAGGPLHSIVLVFVASCAGLLAALPSVIAGKARAKMHIPFGPFLILGLIVVRLFGSAIIAWYTRQVAG